MEVLIAGPWLLLVSLAVVLFVIRTINLCDYTARQGEREREYFRRCRAVIKASPTCFVVTADQWAELMQWVVLLPLLSVVLYAFFRDWERYEFRIRRFLRRRRIRAIRARRLAA